MVLGLADLVISKFLFSRSVQFSHRPGRGEESDAKYNSIVSLSLSGATSASDCPPIGPNCPELCCDWPTGCSIISILSGQSDFLPR